MWVFFWYYHERFKLTLTRNLVIINKFIWGKNLNETLWTQKLYLSSNNNSKAETNLFSFTRFSVFQCNFQTLKLFMWYRMGPICAPKVGKGQIWDSSDNRMTLVRQIWCQYETIANVDPRPIPWVIRVIWADSCLPLKDLRCKDIWSPYVRR